MISVIHTPVDEQVAEDDDFLIPAGGRRMEMDWEQVAAAFQSAVEHLGWDADLEILPERQRVIVRFPPDRADLVGSTMSEFYRVIADAIGMDQFMSIWIDYLSRR